MKRKLFVLSMDAMIGADIAYLEQKPHFKAIMNKRAQVGEVHTVYPASTYPAHTTLVTGCTPGKHGIYSNFPLRTDGDPVPRWYLYTDSVYVEDVFAAAKRAGLTTAAVFWPITGRNPHIDHVINEYFFYYGSERDRVEEVFAAQGADEVALRAVRENLCYFPQSDDIHASIFDRFDDFLMGCTCSLIRDVQPDVLLVHNSYIDTVRHQSGVFGEAVDAALDRADAWLGDVIAAMKDAGVYEQTDFVILSDHGQQEYTRTVRMNALLAQGGFIDIAPDGSIYHWQAYAQSNGKSTTVHLCDNTNRKLHDRVYAYLRELQARGDCGIENVWRKDEVAQRYGQGGPFSFMVEADAETCFIDLWKGTAVRDIPSDTRRASHGYQPEKGPHAVFLAHGPSFRDGAFIPAAELVDIAPTLAASFGQTLPDADGRVLTELLK